MVSIWSPYLLNFGAVLSLAMPLAIYVLCLVLHRRPISSNCVLSTSAAAWHTLCVSQAIHFLILMSRQGKVRLAKWYSTYTQKERARIIKDTTPLVLARPLKLCNFLDWKVSIDGLSLSVSSQSMHSLHDIPYFIRSHNASKPRDWLRKP